MLQSSETAEDEMMVAYNGPELNECDGILAEALDKYFIGIPWHFIIQESKTITRLFKRKSKLQFCLFLSQTANIN